MSGPNQPFRFLDLPPELRLMFYDQLSSLPVTNELSITSIDQHINTNPLVRPKRLSTLSSVGATCQELSNEVCKHLSGKRHHSITIVNRVQDPYNFFIPASAAPTRPSPEVVEIFSRVTTLRLMMEFRTPVTAVYLGILTSLLDILTASTALVKFEYGVDATSLRNASSNRLGAGTIDARLMKIKMEALREKRERGGDDKGREFFYARKTIESVMEVLSWRGVSY